MFRLLKLSSSRSALFLKGRRFSQVFENSYEVSLLKSPALAFPGESVELSGMPASFDKFVLVQSLSESPLAPVGTICSISRFRASDGSLIIKGTRRVQLLAHQSTGDVGTALVKDLDLGLTLEEKKKGVLMVDQERWNAESVTWVKSSWTPQQATLTPAAPDLVAEEKLCESIYDSFRSTVLTLRSWKISGNALPSFIANNRWDEKGLEILLHDERKVTTWHDFVKSPTASRLSRNEMLPSDAEATVRSVQPTPEDTLTFSFAVAAQLKFLGAGISPARLQQYLEAPTTLARLTLLAADVEHIKRQLQEEEKKKDGNDGGILGELAFLFAWLL